MPLCARDARAHRIARLAVLLAAGVLAAGLASCASGEEPEAEPSPAAAPKPEPTEASEPEEGSEGTSIRLLIDGRTFEATLWDNPAAQSLVAQLPLTLEFSDYGRQEVLAEPPRPLTMDGMPSGESAPAGTIGYYAPGGAVVLYYTDVGRFTGIVRIGEIDGDLSELRGWTGPRSVTIELAG